MAALIRTLIPEAAIMRGKAFAIVGHQHWGKSKTLAALTNEDTHQRRCVIKSQEFFVRCMSNDDVPLSFYDRLGNLTPERWPYVILALCPTFADKKRGGQLIRALRSFRKKYQLFFFVLRTDYYRQSRQITEDEIDALSRFGKVKVFSDVKADPEKRARAQKVHNWFGVILKISAVHTHDHYLVHSFAAKPDG